MRSSYPSPSPTPWPGPSPRPAPLTPPTAASSFLSPFCSPPASPATGGGSLVLRVRGSQHVPEDQVVGVQRLVGAAELAGVVGAAADREDQGAGAEEASGGEQARLVLRRHRGDAAVGDRDQRLLGAQK